MIIDYTIETLKRASVDYGLQVAIYGDIDIESHKAWEVKVSTLAGIIILFHQLLTILPVI